MKRVLLCITLMASTLAARAELEWSVYTLFDNQIFPSFAWTSSYLGNEASGNETGNFYGDPNAQLMIIFPQINKGTKVKIVVEAPEIMETSVQEFEMGYKRELFFAAPQILFKWSALEKWKQPRPVPVKITTYINGKLNGEKSMNLIVRSINDCPYLLISDFSTIIDLNYIYTAYVNENHPVITDQILPEIMKQNIIDKVTGYQGSIDDVYKQVYAVWHYFNKNEFQYSSLSSYFSSSEFDEFPFIAAQYVRTFEEIYKLKQANCVDGTVLMASILMRMGIKPYLVTTANHCYLGFSLDGSDSNIAYLETTLLGEDLMKQDKETIDIVQNYTLTDSDTYFRLTFGKNTFDNFVWALLVGQLNWETDKGKYFAENEMASFQVSPDDAYENFIKLNYQRISVQKYREMGLLPLNN